MVGLPAQTLPKQELAPIQIIVALQLVNPANHSLALHPLHWGVFSLREAQTNFIQE
jgi:hypothetical protein